MNRNHIIAVAALLATGMLLYSQRRQHQPVTAVDEPRPTEDDVIAAEQVTSSEPTYVGRQVCKECHAENFLLHGKHGHASTFASTSDPEIANKFVGKKYDMGQQYGTYTYHANDEGLFAQIPEKTGEQSFPLQYALGSGHNAITLLTLMPDPEKGTAGIEHRASWFRNGDRLGPTPGQENGIPATVAELFGHKHVGKVMHRCVYCHVTTGTIVGQQIVDLTPNVNCEKCHGPASVHVQQARAMQIPPPFSVGRDVWDTESEIQLCGDCHRLPASVSQQELRDYPNHLTRFQPIGMLRSECYLASEGKLKCTTCHDPHTTVTANSGADYVQTCASCHPQDSNEHVACPVSPTTGCVECHMPRVKFDDLGTSFHDHWIRIRNDSE